MFCILLFGSGMAIFANYFEKKSEPKTESSNKKPNIVAFIFSILSIFFGSSLILTSICVFTNVIKGNSEAAPIVAFILGTILIVLGVKGIRVYKKRKEITSNNQPV